MNSNKKIIKMEDMKVKLSTLWVVVMFNLLAADILSLYIPGALEEMAEFAGETPITQLMLGGAIMMEIAIAMIFLSRVLKYRANRWANCVFRRNRPRVPGMSSTSRSEATPARTLYTQVVGIGKGESTLRRDSPRRLSR